VGSEFRTREEDVADENCLTCDGTGFVCDICGESEAACECMESKDEARPTYSDCPDCGDDDE
jgi:hypothetical protein